MTSVGIAKNRHVETHRMADELAKEGRKEVGGSKELKIK